MSTDKSFVWTRADVLGVSNACCSVCWGLGLVVSNGGKERPCLCALRGIFRACYARFRQCALKEGFISRVSMESAGFHSRRSKHRVWGMKNEEYLADFVLVSHRALDTLGRLVFALHIVESHDWTICTKRLGMDRGEFFHEVYRVQQILGQAFRELKPYPLFPVDEYFGSAPGGPKSVSPASAPVSPGPLSLLQAAPPPCKRAGCGRPVRRREGLWNDFCSPWCQRSYAIEHVWAATKPRYMNVARELRIMTGKPTPPHARAA